MSNNAESLSRSRRSKAANKESNLALLKNIKKAKDSGTKYKEDYVEENIFDFISYDEYEQLKEKRLKGNISEDDSEYYDDGKEIFDDNRDQIVVVEKKRKTEMSDKNLLPSLFDQLKYKGLTQVYWIDVYHDEKVLGAVFLFGKNYEKSTNSFVNCCVKIDNLERRVYFLARGIDPNMAELRQELTTVLDKYQVHSYRCDVVTRNCAFPLAVVPSKAEYMMVQYSAMEPILPSNLTGQTFSRVFGCDTSVLELFILDLKLKGPCWLNFEDLKPSRAKFSISKFDFECHGIMGISKCEQALPYPPLTLLSINVKTIVDPGSNTKEIVSVGGLIHNEITFKETPPTKGFQSHFAFITNSKETTMPDDVKHKLASCEWGPRYNSAMSVEISERALLNHLLATIHKNNPDIIVGHSLFGNQLQILLQRCRDLNISFWYRLGRLIRNNSLDEIMSQSNPKLERMATVGRLICDTEFSGREFVKCSSYELSDMVKSILPSNLHQLQIMPRFFGADLSKHFVNSRSVKLLIDLTMDEALSNIYLMHKLWILPLAYEMTAICGNIMAQTLSDKKWERNEYLLLHSFTEKDYIAPDNIWHEDQEKETTGGLVLEQKRGYYDNFISLIDESIIEECHNIIDQDKCHSDNASGMASNIENIIELATNDSTQSLAILLAEIKNLVESRNEVKRLLQVADLSKETKIQYNIRQKALKIITNTMYHGLGLEISQSNDDDFDVDGINPPDTAYVYSCCHMWPSRGCADRSCASRAERVLYN